MSTPPKVSIVAATAAGFLKLLCRTRHQHDLGAFLQKLLGRCLTDAAGSASDDGNLAVQSFSRFMSWIHHHSPETLGEKFGSKDRKSKAPTEYEYHTKPPCQARWATLGELFEQMSAWVKSGQIKFREDIVEGLENAPQAFIGLLKGKNFGKPAGSS